MLTPKNDLRSIFTMRYQNALIVATNSANKQIQDHINKHQTWRMLPIGEKTNLFRAKLLNSITENFEAIEPDKFKIHELNSNKSSKVGSVCIATIGNIGLHLVSKRGENSPTLRNFRMNQQYSKTLFGDQFEEINSELSRVKIYDCIYKRKGNKITELIIWNPYDSECEDLILLITENNFAPLVEHNTEVRPKIALKSSMKSVSEGGKVVKQ